MQTTYLLHADTGLNLEGLVVEGIYDNGKRERLSVSADNILGFSTENVSEELPVTVVIDGKQASFIIKVVDYVIKDGVLTEVFNERRGGVSSSNRCKGNCFFCFCFLFFQ
ncbi:bacterial Ig-like domain-containing protein [Phocaeicola coprocola]|uniref:bacterial Ig-like domain-containing protein n=1 Tax=Phocaeicola coprocola TaxID=310298 RepID=UPI0039952782